MDSFTSTLGVAGGVGVVVVAAIIVLSLYFTAVSRLSNKGASVESLTIRGVLGKDMLATVQMAGGMSLERVRLVGFANTGPGKNRVPFELGGLVILEDEDQQRTLVRAKDIRVIVVPPPTA